ncbi:hypothetical protein HK102_007850, partial [Quaeritorhiza haematococci]
MAQIRVRNLMRILAAVVSVYFTIVWGAPSPSTSNSPGQNQNQNEQSHANNSAPISQQQTEQHNLPSILPSNINGSIGPSIVEAEREALERLLIETGMKSIVNDTGIDLSSDDDSLRTPTGSSIITDPSLLADLKRYTQLSAIAYCPSDVILEWTCTPCLTSPSLQHTTSTHSFHHTLLGISGFTAIDTERRLIIVVFRGTFLTRNWVQNFMTVPVPAPGIVGSEGSQMWAWIHVGFLAAYHGVRDQVRQIITSLRNQHEGFEVVFTGHSLGGALGTVAIIDFATNPIDEELKPSQ